MKEAEISLKNLFFYILSHWKSLIFGMVLMAVICGFVGSYKEMLSANASVSATQNTSIIYLVEADSPDVLISVHQSLLAMMGSSEFYGYVSSVTNVPASELTKFISVAGVDAKTGNKLNYFVYDSATMAAIVINIYDVSEDAIDSIKASVETYIIFRSEELSQKGYKHKLIKTGIFDYGDDVENESGIVQEEQNEIHETAMSAPAFSIKFAIIGFALGLFVVACWHFLIYVFANRLEEDDDIENLFGFYMLGLIPGKDFGKPLYKLQNIGKRTFSPEDTCKLIATKISMAADKNNVSKIGIIGCDIVKHSKELSEKLVKLLGESGLDVTLIDNPLYDESSVKALNDMDHVVLFEKAGETIRTEILKETEMAKNLGITIDGLVMVGR